MLKRMRRWMAEGDEALFLAAERVRSGVPEDQIVREVQALPGSRTALRLAARTSGIRATDWPAVRVHAVLVAASTGAPVVPATPEDLAAYQDQRELLALPWDEAFEFLAARLPSLRDLLRKAEQTMPRMKLPSPSDELPASEGPHFKAFMALHQEAAALVGPRSGQPDRLLASGAALRVVSRAILGAGGIARGP